MLLSKNQKKLFHKIIALITAFCFSTILFESHAAEYLLSLIPFVPRALMLSPILLVITNLILFSLQSIVLYYVYEGEFNHQQESNDLLIEKNKPYQKRLLNLLYLAPFLVALITACANFSEFSLSLSWLLSSFSFQSYAFLYYSVYAVAAIAGCGLFTYMFLRGKNVMDRLFLFFTKTNAPSHQNNNELKNSKNLDGQCTKSKQHTHNHSTESNKKASPVITILKSFFRLVNVLSLLLLGWYLITGSLPFTIISPYVTLIAVLSTLIVTTFIEFVMHSYQFYQAAKKFQNTIPDSSLSFRNLMVAFILSILTTVMQCVFQMFFMTHLIAEAGVECKGSTNQSSMNPLRYFEFLNTKSVFLIAFLSEFFIDAEILGKKDHDNELEDKIKRFSFTKFTIFCLHIPLFFIPSVSIFIPAVSLFSLFTLQPAKTNQSINYFFKTLLLYSSLITASILIFHTHFIIGPICSVIILCGLHLGTLQKIKTSKLSISPLIFPAGLAALICGYMSTYELSIVFPLPWHAFFILMISGMLVETAVWMSSIKKGIEPNNTAFSPVPADTIKTPDTATESKCNTGCDHTNLFQDTLDGLILNNVQ